jgi:hypothetical protein
MEGSVTKQFISEDNFNYLQTMVDMTRYDLERFIYNNMNKIDIRLDMWANVRKMNRLYLQLHNKAREPTLKEQIINKFMSKKNVAYLQQQCKLPDKEMLQRVFMYANHDALEFIEDYDQTIKASTISNILDTLNENFLKAYGNTTENSYQDTQLMADSLAPKGYEHFNQGPKGQFYVGPMDEEGYDGNKVNRFFIQGQRRQRIEGIPYYQVLSKSQVDRDISEDLGQKYTEYSQTVYNRGDIDKYKAKHKTNMERKITLTE